MESMNDFSDCVEPINPSNDHTVLFEWPIVLDQRFGGTPKPKLGKTQWNLNFVRLPCSTESQMLVSDPNDESKEIWRSRWEKIQEAYTSKISSSKDLEKAILSYNQKFKDKWKFHALHHLFEDDLDEEESEAFFEDTFPKIVKLALQLPDLIPWSIPLLKQGCNKSVSLSQLQIGCLLANAFLCTFPRRNSYMRRHEYSTFPSINFARIFQSSGQAVLEKIKCFCHYFRRITTFEPPTGVITITRRFMTSKDFPKWTNLDIPVTRASLTVDESGTIEDATGKLQVDFANKFLGGGVLGHGCVQEEIRFVICPELMVTKLFCECMKPNEAILMTGVERYSDYTGYAGSFRWNGNYQDKTQWDTSRRKQCTIVAIDALEFRDGSHQFKEELMLREMNKAYVGFFHGLQSPPPAVASGNWGCGAFNGEPLLKSLLQLIVCAQVNRPLYYFTFRDEQLKQDLEQMFEFLKDNNVTVKNLWRILRDFSSKNLDVDQLYPFIHQSVYDNANSLSPIKRIVEKPARTIKNFFSSKIETLEAGPSNKVYQKKNASPVKVTIVNEKTNMQKKCHLQSTVDQSESTALIEESQSVAVEPELKVVNNHSNGYSLMSALEADYSSYSEEPKQNCNFNEETDDDDKDDEIPPKKICLDQ